MLAIAKAASELEMKESETYNTGVSRGVIDVVSEFGCWLWHINDGGEPPIFHLDGRVFLSAAERKQRGIPDKDARYQIAGGC